MAACSYWQVSISPGMVTVIELWATWCPSCIESMPQLQKLWVCACMPTYVVLWMEHGHAVRGCAWMCAVVMYALLAAWPSPTACDDLSKIELCSAAANNNIRKQLDHLRSTHIRDNMAPFSFPLAHSVTTLYHHPHQTHSLHRYLGMSDTSGFQSTGFDSSPSRTRKWSTCASSWRFL